MVITIFSSVDNDYRNVTLLVPLFCPTVYGDSEAFVSGMYQRQLNQFNAMLCIFSFFFLHRSMFVRVCIVQQNE